MLETLMADGCEILAVVEDHPAFQLMQEELTLRGIPFREAPSIGRREPGYLLDFLIGNPLRYIAAKHRLKALVQEFRPTHIHVPNPFAFLMASASVPSNLPIIYRIGDRPAIHNYPWRWIWRRIVRRVDHFVADSEFIAKFLGELGVARDRITVIYSAPPKRAKPPQPDRRTASPHHVLFIGQLTIDKGVDRLIHAFRSLTQQFPAARLTIAGRISDWSGDDWARTLRDETLHDPRLLDRIEFVGEIEDIYDLLASSAFLVVPSVWDEPFGIVCVEAKAAARAAVVYPRGGLLEQINHGQDGFICVDTSVESLADGLRYYLSDPDRAATHGAAALASLKRLRVNEFGARWRDVYNRADVNSPRCHFDQTPVPCERAERK